MGHVRGAKRSRFFVVGVHHTKSTVSVLHLGTEDLEEYHDEEGCKRGKAGSLILFEMASDSERVKFQDVDIFAVTMLRNNRITRLAS